MERGDQRTAGLAETTASVRIDLWSLTILYIAGVAIAVGVTRWLSPDALTGAPGPRRLGAAALVGLSALSLALPRPRSLVEQALAQLGLSVPGLARFSLVAVQVGVLIHVLTWFHIESPAFYARVAPLAFAGFIVHHLLPLRYRLSFFAALSLAGVYLVFGADGTWLIAVGLILIGLCHLPAPWSMRIAAVAAAGTLLALMRGGVLPTPWSGAIWPIIGSMFMFRLIVYMYDRRHAKEAARPEGTLAYFFLLPNLVFPLFPVVDYATFRRTYYDRDALAIYQRGVHWMLIGVTHILIYRFIYQNLTIPAADVATATDLVRHMITTFLLYLKISGQFHLIIGMLHLFGFRLPETHSFFFLASSFTDLWRRINIYWKDFMMKVFYYPIYFRLRKRGDTFALVVSTLLVFVITWALHSYQWFWLLGATLLTVPDMLFWAFLGLILVTNMLRESKAGRARAIGGVTQTPRERLAIGVRIVAVFLSMSVLWSFWSSHTVGEWLGLWRVRVSGGEVVFLGIALVLAVLAAALLAPLRETGARAVATAPSFRRPWAINAAWIALLALAGPPALARGLPPNVQAVLRDVRVDMLNSSDADLIHRGYYENLTVVNQFNSALWRAYAQRPADWKSIIESDAILPLDGDYRKWLLRPLHSTLHNGVVFRTNRWGMRDQEYELEPSAGTYRVALLGASYSMGEGVQDHETFEARLEAAVARQRTTREPPLEILNFSVPTFNPAQNLVHLERTVLDFQPDVIVLITHSRDPTHIARHTARMYLGGVEIPYDFLREPLETAGVTDRMTLDEAANRLTDDRMEMTYRTFERIARVCVERGVRPILLYLATPEHRATDAEVQELVELAARAGFETIDLAAVYDDHNLAELVLAPWDGHPNALGHRLIATKLLQLMTDGHPALQWPPVDAAEGAAQHGPGGRTEARPVP